MLHAWIAKYKTEITLTADGASIVFTKLATLCRPLLAGLLISFATTALAEETPLSLDASTNGNNFSSSSSASGSSLSFGVPDQEFLRVEEAYILTPLIEQDHIRLQWSIAPGYYLYQEKFKFAWNQGGEKQPVTPDFEPGKRIFDEYFQKELTVYYQQTDITLPLPADPGSYELIVESQGCADAGLCYPPRTQYFQVDTTTKTATETLARRPATMTETGNNASSDSAEPQEQPFLPMILLAALLGGVILNLMPCVFPVLSLKALSFASSHLSRHKQHVHGWAYTAGIVCSFLLAAVIILFARTAGETVGWGFQLQSPVFVALMAYLFFTMSLSLAGLFDLGTRLMGVGQSLTSGHGLRASFFTGVLAALVASPCTAPFMASALGFAMTQPAYVALAVFAALGLGMALPFLLLSYSPGLAKRLPQPGPWMEVLKQLLAFPLLLTCVWLLWVLGHQAGSDAVSAVLLGATAIAFGCWIWQKSPASRTGKLLVRLLALAAIATALLIAAQINRSSADNEALWQPYSAEKLASLRADATPVFVNLTADWCITCLANDRVALDTDAVETAAKELGVAMLKGDWTNGDPAITQLLKEFSRSGVPLYVMYPASTTGEAEVLPQVLTPQRVVQAMERATQI